MRSGPSVLSCCAQTGSPGCSNRLGWDEALDEAMFAASRFGAPLIVARIDLDSSKNPTTSAAGTDLPRQQPVVSFASRARKVVRNGDLFARLDGDVLVVALSRCPAPMATMHPGADPHLGRRAALLGRLGGLGRRGGADGAHGAGRAGSDAGAGARRRPDRPPLTAPTSPAFVRRDARFRAPTRQVCAHRS